MVKDDRTKIEIDREKEMRTKETSKMISEGGLGSRTYYDIKKTSSTEKESNDTNEGTKKQQNKDEK
ncbi:hypothetical protein [Pseudogracilibacillus sp. SO30301A]|uniref:hypothetical protein n=1 Tax=Pseudogracilibacillus sp. SO30301A TaxID=3098291 RepID=UPI00300DF7DE